MPYKVMLHDRILAAINAPPTEVASYRWRWLATIHAVLWNSTGVSGTFASVVHEPITQAEVENAR